MNPMSCGYLLEAPPDPALDPFRFLWPAVGILAGLIVLIVAFSLTRKRIKQTEAGPPAGFALSDLRQLVKEGKMSPEEFARAKNKVLDATKRASAVKPARETVSPKEFHSPPQQ